MRKPESDLVKAWAAANFAANAFIRLYRVDLTEEEMSLAIAQPNYADPEAVRDCNARTRIATLALLTHDSALARRVLREFMHPSLGEETEFSDRDLQDIAEVLNEISGRVFRNLNPHELRRKLDAWLENASVPQRRASVLVQVDGAGSAITQKQTKALIEELAARGDARFATLDVRKTQEILRQLEPDESQGGTRSDGTARLGVLGAAAKLSVMAGAFGDTKEKAAKQAYFDAKKAEGKELAVRQQEARDIGKKLARRAKNRQG